MIKNKPLSDHFVYGLHTVSALLEFQPERCKKLFIARSNDMEDLQKLCNKNRIAYEKVDRLFLEKKFNVGSDAQGLVLTCSAFAYTDLDEVLVYAKKLLILDSLQDAANVGRAARAALVFGIDAVIICKDRSAQVTPAAEKSAVGALARVPVVRVTNLSSAINKIKETGFFVYGADERGSVAIGDCDFAQKAALVIGQEGEGLRDLTKQNCDVLVNIPMENSSICLNAADAALLMAYELNRKK